MINKEKHRFILLNILKDIYKDPQIRTSLGFKGGTALYFFYDLPRFSTDLDFDLINGEEKVVMKRLKKILKNYGSLKEATNKRNTLFFLLSYDEDAKNIKVEISKRDYPNEYELKDYLGVSMKVMKKEYMFSHKLVALLDRPAIANRDLFDIWFFMKENTDFNKEIVKIRTNLEVKKYFDNCIEKIKNINENYLLQGMGEVLEESQKDWVKNNLKEELIFLFRYYLKNKT